MQGYDSYSTVTYSSVTNVPRCNAASLPNRDEPRDAAKCSDCHQDNGMSSDLLQDPILILHGGLQRLLHSRLLLYYYRSEAYCLPNRDEPRDAAKCSDCHQDNGMSSYLLQDPILILHGGLQRLLHSRLLLYYYRSEVHCLPNRDEPRDAAKCSDCHQDNGMSS